MLRRGLAITVLAIVGLFALASCSGEKKKLTVNEIYPRIGPYTGGDPVSIRGSGFQSGGSSTGLKVYFGKSLGRDIVIVNDAEIRVSPPAGEKDQQVDVEIVFDDARVAKLPKAYKYIDPIGEQPM